MTLTWPGSCEWLMAGSCPPSPRAAGLVVVLVVELAAPARHAREQHVVAEVVGLLKVLHGARGAFVRRQFRLVGTRVLGARRLAERQRRDDARQVRQLLAVSLQVLLEAAPAALFLAHELALVTRRELAPRDVAAHVE